MFLVKYQTLASSLQKKNTKPVEETSPFKNQGWGTDITTLIFEKCDALQLLLLARVSKTAYHFLNKRCLQVKHCRMVEDLLGPSTIDLKHSDHNKIQGLRKELIKKKHIYHGDPVKLNNNDDPKPKELAVKARLLFEWFSISKKITNLNNNGDLKTTIQSELDLEINQIKPLVKWLPMPQPPILRFYDSKFSRHKYSAIKNLFLHHGLEAPTFILYHKYYTYIGTVGDFGFHEGVLYMKDGDRNFKYTGSFIRGNGQNDTKEKPHGQGRFQSMHDLSADYSGVWDKGKLTSAAITIEIDARDNYKPTITKWQVNFSGNHN